MKAWVLHGIGDLRLEETKEPSLAPDEVLVAVKAVGICGSDLPRIYETGAYSHPLIPGHEFSGQVVKLGANADTTWMYKRVGIYPLIPCKTCLPCQHTQYEMCRNYSYLGSRRDGGFAEYVAVPVWNLLPLPDEVSYEAAAMLEPMSVAAHALRRQSLDLTAPIAVCGLGTIGLLLTMLLKEAGAKHLLLIGNKTFQKQKILELGLPLESYCDAKTEDVSTWLLEHTGGLGASHFFECVGNPETISLALTHTAPAGTITLVGNPHGDPLLKKETYWKILRHQLKLSGTWNSSFTHQKDDDWNYILALLQQKSITPSNLISHRFPLEFLDQGLHIMKNKTEDYLKIIAVMGH